MFKAIEELSNILAFDEQFLIQLGVQLLATCILVFIMAKLLYKPVLEFLKKRKEKIRRELDESALSLADANALKADYEKRLSAIDAERSEILEQARIRSLEKEEQIVAEARAEAALILQRAKLEVERERDKAKDDMKTQIIEISSLMAGRFVATAIDEKTQNKLLDEVISDLGAMTWLS